MAESAFRWWVKKVARHGVLLSSSLSGSMALSALMAPGPRVRVLTYHRFGNIPRDPFCVTEADFERQVAHLAETRAALSLDDLIAFLDGRKELSPDAVLVTIDDGYRSTMTVAHEVLRKHEVPAIAFVTPSLIDAGEAAHGAPIADGPEPYLTWDELRRIADEGMTIGSHSWSHRSMGSLSLDEAAEEARRSRDALERELRRPVLSYAYPYGTRADYSEAIAERVAHAGYKVAFTSQHGPVWPTRKGSVLDALMLPRIKIEAGEGQLAFRLAIRGGLDAWRLVDQTLWRLQAAHR
jgi:peptidoglycan/xylan/chitin deacetylase (PgdA/CDA1 family)